MKNIPLYFDARIDPLRSNKTIKIKFNNQIKILQNKTDWTT